MQPCLRLTKHTLPTNPLSKHNKLPNCLNTTLQPSPQRRSEAHTSHQLHDCCIRLTGSRSHFEVLAMCALLVSARERRRVEPATFFPLVSFAISSCSITTFHVCTALCLLPHRARILVARAHSVICRRVIHAGAEQLGSLWVCQLGQISTLRNTQEACAHQHVRQSG